jgi:hypothetical protein
MLALDGVYAADDDAMVATGGLVPTPGEADRFRHRQVERAEYEAATARQRCMHVDPANGRQFERVYRNITGKPDRCR